MANIKHNCADLFEQLNDAELISVLSLSFFYVGIVQFYHTTKIVFLPLSPFITN